MNVRHGRAPLPWLCVVPFAGVCCTLVYLFVVRGMTADGRFQVGPRQTISALMLFVVFEFLTASVVVDFHIVSLRGNWVVILMCEFYCLTILFLQNALFKKAPSSMIWTPWTSCGTARRNSICWPARTSP